MKALREWNTPIYLKALIDSYVSNRELLINAEEIIELNCGVPQGSVRGPYLWSLVYDKILRLRVRLVAYVDDLVILTVVKEEVAN